MSNRASHRCAVHASLQGADTISAMASTHSHSRSHSRGKRAPQDGLPDKGAGGDSVRAVDRALEILMAFSASDHELTVAELLKRVQLSRPTLYRLLHTLQQAGFVSATGEPQRFRLGPAVGHLAHVWSASMDIAGKAGAVMHGLGERTGETVALFVPEGSWRRCVAEVASSHPLSFRRGVGYRERIVLGASGRVILAHAPDPDARLDELAREPGAPPIDMAWYRRELALITQRGYGVSRDELIQGAVAVAAPFFDGSGRVAGSMAVFGPSARVDEARVAQFGAWLILAGRELSVSLGWSERPHPGKVS